MWTQRQYRRTSHYLHTVPSIPSVYSFGGRLGYHSRHSNVGGRILYIPFVLRGLLFFYCVSYVSALLSPLACQLHHRFRFSFRYDITKYGFSISRICVFYIMAFSLPRHLVLSPDGNIQHNSPSTRQGPRFQTRGHDPVISDLLVLPEWSECLLPQGTGDA